MLFSKQHLKTIEELLLSFIYLEKPQKNFKGPFCHFFPSYVRTLLKLKEYSCLEYFLTLNFVENHLKGMGDPMLN